MEIRLKEGKPERVDNGAPGWCPKKKGGRWYQAEVLQLRCKRCRQKAKYCPEKLKEKSHEGE